MRFLFLSKCKSSDFQKDTFGVLDFCTTSVPLKDPCNQRPPPFKALPVQLALQQNIPRFVSASINKPRLDYFWNSWTKIGLRLALYPPSRAAPWFLMAACWTSPPPPPARCASAADTPRAPLGDTRDGSLSAPAGSARWVLQNVTAASAGSCFPGSECAASCT